MTRVLVTGDRHCRCEGLARRAVARMAARYGPGLVIVHGDAPGVDAAFRGACEALGVAQEPHPARWELHRNAAGPIRNAEMVAAGAAFCLAVHADLGRSKGTGDCVRRCLAADIPVWHFDPTSGDETPKRLEGAP